MSPSGFFLGSMCLRQPGEDSGFHPTVSPSFRPPPSGLPWIGGRGAILAPTGGWKPPLQTTGLRTRLRLPSCGRGALTPRYSASQRMPRGVGAPRLLLQTGAGSSAYICDICEICLPVPACAHRAGKRGRTQTGGWFGSPAKAVWQENSGNGLVGGTLTPLGHRKATATVLRQGGSRGFAPTRGSRNQKTKTDLDTAPPSLCQVVSIKGTLKSNCPLYLYAFSREAAAHGPAAHFLSPRWIEATCLSAPASPPSGMATGSSCASSETQGRKTTAPDTAYRYRVRAITYPGLPGGFSAEAVAATKAKPVAAAPSPTSGRP